MAWHDLFEATGEAVFEQHYDRAVEGLATTPRFLPANPTGRR